MKSLTRSQLGLSKKVIQNKIISTLDEWRSTPEYQAKRQETMSFIREKVFTENSAKTDAEKRALNRKATKEALNLFRIEQKALFQAQLSQ
jgi:hypothetical protein